MEKVGKYRANTIARYFLFKMPMSQKKLHKMLFFAYSWYLFQNNDDADKIKNVLFLPKNDNFGFQAWVHGPVFREIYPDYCENGFKDILINKFDENVIDDNDKKFFDEIFDVYGDNTADELEELSHTFHSWKNARLGYNNYEACKECLNDKDIYNDIMLY